MGILINALVTGLAVLLQHDSDALDPKLLVRAVRQLAGLDAAAAGDGSSDSATPSSRPRRKGRVRPS